MPFGEPMSAIEFVVLVLSPIAAGAGLAPIDALLGGTPLALPLLNLRRELLFLPVSTLSVIGL